MIELAFILGTTLMYATPLIYTALGATITEHSGVVNIGLEGMMYMGAFAGAAVGYAAGNPWIGFIAAGIAGGLLASLHGIACVSFGPNHIVSGIAIFIGITVGYYTNNMWIGIITTAITGGLLAYLPGKIARISFKSIYLISGIAIFVGIAVGYLSQSIWIGLIITAITGGLLIYLPKISSLTFGANHIVSGIAINFIGVGLALFLCRIFFKNATMTIPLPLDDKISRPLNGIFMENSFWDNVFNQYTTVYLAFFMVLLVWFMLYKTRLGIRIRSVGEHPEAADTLGINVFKTKHIAVILSGVFAGFGGAAMSIAIVSRFQPTLISGHGFIALAAMIFGNWKPQGAMLACLLFGSAKGLEIFLGSTKGIQLITDFQQKLFGTVLIDQGVPAQILAMLPYIITLLFLIGFVGKAVPPSASGQSYEKN